MSWPSAFLGVSVAVPNRQSNRGGAKLENDATR
jgi:hypothetical protein